MLGAARAAWQKAEQPVEADGNWEGGSACPPLRVSRDVVAGAAVGFVTGFSVWGAAF